MSTPSAELEYAAVGCDEVSDDLRSFVPLRIEVVEIGPSGDIRLSRTTVDRGWPAPIGTFRTGYSSSHRPDGAFNELLDLGIRLFAELELARRLD